MSKLLNYKEEIISKYQAGLTLASIAKEYRVDARTVSKLLKDNGVEILSATESARKVTAKYYDYFSTVDTEDKAYFVGLLQADGCIYNPKNSQRQMKLTLKNEDLYILQTLKNNIGITSKLVDDKRGCSTLTVCSTGLCNDLEVLGVSSLKYTRNSMPTIDKDLLPHFIRGYFDGDGCVSSASKSRVIVNFVHPNKTFIEYISSYLYENGICSGKITDRTTYYSLTVYGKSNILKFYNLIYTDSKTLLTRKKLKYDNILEELKWKIRNE